MNRQTWSPWKAVGGNERFTRKITRALEENPGESLSDTKDTATEHGKQLLISVLVVLCLAVLGSFSVDGARYICCHRGRRISSNLWVLCGYASEGSWGALYRGMRRLAKCEAEIKNSKRHRT